MCKAFGDRRLVILIDDLDRCKPKQVVEILEAVNFLTANGECFVLLGFDEHQVRNAVGLHYKEAAEEMARGKGWSTVMMSLYEARQSYADLYLEKLINLEVKVPLVDRQEMGDRKEAEH